MSVGTEMMMVLSLGDFTQHRARELHVSSSVRQLRNVRLRVLTPPSDRRVVSYDDYGFRLNTQRELLSDDLKFGHEEHSYHKSHLT